VKPDLDSKLCNGSTLLIYSCPITSRQSAYRPFHSTEKVSLLLLLIWAPRLIPSTIRFYFLIALPWPTTHSPGLPHTLPTAHSNSWTLEVAHRVSQWIAAFHKDQFRDPWSSFLIRKILSTWRMNTIHCHTSMLMTHNCTPPAVDLKIATSSEHVFRTASLTSHCGAPLVVFSSTLKKTEAIWFESRGNLKKLANYDCSLRVGSDTIQHSFMIWEKHRH